MINVAVTGAGGRMGKTFVELLAQSSTAQLAVATEHPDSSLLGADAGELAGIGKNGVLLQPQLDPAANDFDVLIDFTAPAATLRLQ